MKIIIDLCPINGRNLAPLENFCACRWLTTLLNRTEVHEYFLVFRNWPLSAAEKIQKSLHKRPSIQNIVHWDTSPENDVQSIFENNTYLTYLRFLAPDYVIQWGGSPAHDFLEPFLKIYDFRETLAQYTAQPLDDHIELTNDAAATKLNPFMDFHLECDKRKDHQRDAATTTRPHTYGVELEVFFACKDKNESLGIFEHHLTTILPTFEKEILYFIGCESMNLELVMDQLCVLSQQINKHNSINEFKIRLSVYCSQKEKLNKEILAQKDAELFAPIPLNFIDLGSIEDLAAKAALIILPDYSFESRQVFLWGAALEKQTLISDEHFLSIGADHIGPHQSTSIKNIIKSLAGLSKNSADLSPPLSDERHPEIKFHLENSCSHNTLDRFCEKILSVIDSHNETRPPAKAEQSSKITTNAKGITDQEKRVFRALKENKLQKRLFVDVSELHLRDAKSGIQRVTRNILAALLARPPDGYDVVPVFATEASQGYFLADRILRENITEYPEDKYPQSGPVWFYPGDIFLGLDLTQKMTASQSSTFSAMKLQGVHIAFVIYDLLPVTLPHTFPEGTDWDHEQWLYTISEADQVLCISQSVADNYIAWLCNSYFNHDRDFTVSWFSLGADTTLTNTTCPESATPDKIATKQKQCLNFLVVGTIEPRKKIDQILYAFEQLWGNGLDANLILVGKCGWMVEDLEQKLRTHRELNQRLFWIENASDTTLQTMYTQANCLLLASEGEGYGLPVAEAAQAGLPLLLRDIPVFRELAGNSAIYFSGQSPTALANAILCWIKAHQSESIPLSSKISVPNWQECAEELKEALLDRGYPKHRLILRAKKEALPQDNRMRLNELLLKKHLTDTTKELKKTKYENRYKANRIREYEKLVDNMDITLKNQQRTLEIINSSSESNPNTILKLQKDIETLKNSSSWRVTKPLRIIGEKFKGAPPARAMAADIANNIFADFVKKIQEKPKIRNFIKRWISRSPRLYKLFWKMLPASLLKNIGQSSLQRQPYGHIDLHSLGNKDTASYLARLRLSREKSKHK